MKRIHILWGLAAVFVFSLIGCLEIPLGNPDTSTVDDQFVGLWLNDSQNDNESELLAVMPFDSHSYLISQMKFVKTDAGYQSHGQENLKAWLTKIGDTTFITVEPKDPKSLIESEDKAYIVAKIVRTGDKVSLQQVDEKFVKAANVTTREALAKLVADNLQNPKLYESDSMSYTRMNAEQIEKAKGILGAFAEPKQQNASIEPGNGTGL